MKKNFNIEVEGSELILKNRAGDYVVIPKKYRVEVMGMINDECHGCIDALVETLPVMADYAPDGSLIPNNPNTFLHQVRNPFLQNNTKKPVNVDPQYQNLKNYRPEPIILKQASTAVVNSNKSIPRSNTPSMPGYKVINKPGTIIQRPDGSYTKTPDETKYDKVQRLKNEAYQEKVRQGNIKRAIEDAENSTANKIANAMQYPLRAMASPFKYVGDLTYQTTGWDPGLGSLRPEIQAYQEYQANPYVSNSDKTKRTINKGLDLTNDALINVGTAELGYTFMSPTITNPLAASTFTNRILQSGSKANTTADFLQLTRIDPEKIMKGDLNEIFSGLIGLIGVGFHGLSNFDASGIYNRIKNWDTMDYAAKKDLLKDIANLGLAAQQQTQRTSSK